MTRRSCMTHRGVAWLENLYVVCLVFFSFFYISLILNESNVISDVYAPGESHRLMFLLRISFSFIGEVFAGWIRFARSHLKDCGDRHLLRGSFPISLACLSLSPSFPSLLASPPLSLSLAHLSLPFIRPFLPRTTPNSLPFRPPSPFLSVVFFIE